MRKSFIVVILVVAVIIIAFMVFSKKEESINQNIRQGTYLSEDGGNSKCDREILRNDPGNMLYLDHFYDDDNNLVGNCTVYSGAVPLGMKCPLPGNCTSQDLLNPPIEEGECQGRQDQKYNCYFPMD